jgi:hypothetical protein
MILLREDDVCSSSSVSSHAGRHLVSLPPCLVLLLLVQAQPFLVLMAVQLASQVLAVELLVPVELVPIRFPFLLPFPSYVDESFE